MADIHWIKLRVDMFDDEKIKIIQSLPEGDSILVIWIRILALAGKCNANGLVLVEDEFPYTDEMLSVIFNKPLATVRLALATFERFRMIENTEKGFYITNFEKHQNTEGLDKIREQNRLRKQREREKKNTLMLEPSPSAMPALPDGVAENKVVTDETTGLSRDVTKEVTVMSRDMSRDTSRNVTKEVTGMSRDVTQQREKENKNINNISISSNENIDIVGGAPTEPPLGTGMKGKNLRYDMIIRDYNNTCVELTKILTISESRRRAVRSLVNELEKLKILPGMDPYEKLHKIFIMTNESDFLSYRDGKWGGCSFDWLMNKKNALKVLEGTYANKGGVGNGRNSTEPGTGGTGSTGNGVLGDTTKEALERYLRNRGDDGP